MAAKPGERKLQILQNLAEMLQKPQGEKITTASLAAKIGVSEAALYRHFASKAQMFEGLIEFIEQTLFGLINKVTSEENNGVKQLETVLPMLLGFAQKNPGMTRVLIGEALVNEDEPPPDPHQPAARPPGGHAQAVIAAGREPAGNLGRNRCRRSGQPDDELRGRALAPVRQERLQARADGVLGGTGAGADQGVRGKRF